MLSLLRTFTASLQKWWFDLWRRKYQFFTFLTSDWLVKVWKHFLYGASNFNQKINFHKGNLEISPQKSNDTLDGSKLIADSGGWEIKLRLGNSRNEGGFGGGFAGGRIISPSWFDLDEGGADLLMFESMVSEEWMRGVTSEVKEKVFNEQTNKWTSTFQKVQIAFIPLCVISNMKPLSLHKIFLPNCFWIAHGLF